MAPGTTGKLLPGEKIDLNHAPAAERVLEFCFF